MEEKRKSQEPGPGPARKDAEQERAEIQKRLQDAEKREQEREPHSGAHGSPS